MEVFFKFHVTRFHCHDIQWQTETKKVQLRHNKLIYFEREKHLVQALET